MHQFNFSSCNYMKQIHKKKIIWKCREGFFWCAWTLRYFISPMEASDLCASSGTIMGIGTDCGKGNNSEFQNLKLPKIQSTLISTLP